MIKKYWFEAKNISCIKNGYKVVKELNLKLEYAENIILMGPNGSGKSSLVELMTRTIYPIVSNDKIFKIFGKEIINLWELRKRISTVNTDIKNRIDPKLKVIDLIASGLYGKYCFVPNKTNEDKFLIRKIIKIMKLENISEKFFYYLSDGEKQIVLIARALINKPDVLILDEPTANLDYKSKYYVIDKINELSESNTLIFCITHDISMITNIYNRILMIKNRTIIADGKPNDIINSKNIKELFDINIDVMRGRDCWEIKRISKL